MVMVHNNDGKSLSSIDSDDKPLDNLDNHHWNNHDLSSNNPGTVNMR